jgi:hypothetical protein
MTMAAASVRETPEENLSLSLSLSLCLSLSRRASLSVQRDFCLWKEFCSPRARFMCAKHKNNFNSLLTLLFAAETSLSFSLAFTRRMRVSSSRYISMFYAAE